MLPVGGSTLVGGMDVVIVDGATGAVIAMLLLIAADMSGNGARSVAATEAASVGFTLSETDGAWPIAPKDGVGSA